jgi:hypothetical protein
VHIDRIREDMSVISADDHCVGFVTRLMDGETLRIISITAGYGYNRLIPLSWVSHVDKFVYLSKTSSYVTANWRKSSYPRSDDAAGGDRSNPLGQEPSLGAG